MLCVCLPCRVFVLTFSPLFFPVNRAFVSEELHEQKRKRPLALFFGCHGESKDFYFRSKWEELMHRHLPLEEGGGGGFRMFCAFSRDQEEKVYMQHRILSKEFLLKKFLYRRQGGFFVAGSDRQMPDWSWCCSAAG